MLYSKKLLIVKGVPRSLKGREVEENTDGALGKGGLEIHTQVMHVASELFPRSTAAGRLASSKSPVCTKKSWTSDSVYFTQNVLFEFSFLSEAFRAMYLHL